MKFYNLSFHDTVIKRVCFHIDVNIDFFKAETQVESELFDFEDLIIGLGKMNQREWKTVIFSPTERQFSMQFDLQENGLIKVHVKLNNLMFTARLDFTYMTDQTFIPKLIQEIELVMKGKA